MDEILRELKRAAAAAYGEQRSAEMGAHLADVARWLWLVQQQPLDLLDEEPDNGR